MATDRPGIVARHRDRPYLDDVYEAMVPGRCYVVADLLKTFAEHDPARSTIRNRLETLADDGRVERRKHVSELVTYRRVEDADD
jgi:hypothetical protein